MTSFTVVPAQTSFGATKATTDSMAGQARTEITVVADKTSAAAHPRVPSRIPANVESIWARSVCYSPTGSQPGAGATMSSAIGCTGGQDGNTTRTFRRPIRPAAAHAATEAPQQRANRNPG